MAENVHRQELVAFVEWLGTRGSETAASRSIAWMLDSISGATTQSADIGDTEGQTDALAEYLKDHDSPFLANVYNKKPKNVDLRQYLELVEKYDKIPTKDHPELVALVDKTQADRITNLRETDPVAADRLVEPGGVLSTGELKPEIVDGQTVPATPQFDALTDTTTGAEVAPLADIVPEDWIPFSERPEFQHTDPTSMPGRLLQSQNIDINKTETDDKISHLRNVMAQIGSGVTTTADIGLTESTATQKELFGDPATGERGYITSGYKFQALTQPKVMAGTFSNVGLRNVLNEFDGMSLYEINAAFHSMTPASQMALKTQMWHAGFYPANQRPDFDGFNVADGEAWQAFIGENQSNPGKAMETLLTERIEDRYSQRRGGLEFDAAGRPMSHLGAQQGRVIRLSDPEVVKDALRNFAAQELGMKVDETQIEAHAATVLAAERANKEQLAAAESSLRNATPGGGTNLEEVDMFLDALTRNTGGKIIDLPSWTMWARRAGMDPAVSPTPENMRTVGRFLASDYYDVAQNWSDAAALWFAGPGKNGQALAGVDGPDPALRGTTAANTPLRRGLPSVDVFQRGVLANMRTVEAERFGLGDSGNVYVQEYDIAAAGRRELIAANRAKHQTWQYSDRAEQFYSLLAEGARI